MSASRPLSADDVLTCALFVLSAGVDVLPLFRLLYAQVAASCSALATALQLRKGLKHVRGLWLESEQATSYWGKLASFWRPAHARRLAGNPHKLRFMQCAAKRLLFRHTQCKQSDQVTAVVVGF